MIQFLLTLCLLILAIYSLRQRSSSPVLAYTMAMLSAAGIVLVINPILATDLANILGVGRGADLLLYTFIILALYALLIVHLKLRATNVLITELARSIAISNARKPSNIGDGAKR